MKYKSLINIIMILSITVPAYSRNFNTIKVTSTALNSQSCLNYRIVSQCIYLYWSCSLFGGCSLKTAFRDRIKHNLPDLVVSAFREPGYQPYQEANALYSAAAVTVMQQIGNTPLMGNQRITGGSAKFVEKNSSNDRMKYNEVNIVGNPAVEAVRRIKKYTVPFINGGPFLCHSSSRSLFPYFMSELDVVAWRSARLNLTNTASWIPGQREISHGNSTVARALQTWGSVHPRIGFVQQTDEVKAAAVVSQRAIDITTQPYQLPHVYTPYGYNGKRSIPNPAMNNAQSCRDGFGEWTKDRYCIDALSSYPDWDLKTDPEKQVISNAQCPLQCSTATSTVHWLRGADERKRAWQMIVPKTQNSCEAFGANNDWAVGKYEKDGKYAWNYWREYECCKPGPGWLIFP